MSDRFDELPEEEGLMGLLAALGRARRPARELAEAELIEGAWGPDLALGAEDDGPVRLAADDRLEREFPVRYAGGPWQVALGLTMSGEAFLLIERGPGPAQVQVGEQEHASEPGQRVPIGELAAPPARLILRSAAEPPLLLEPLD